MHPRKVNSKIVIISDQNDIITDLGQTYFLEIWGNSDNNNVFGATVHSHVSDYCRVHTACPQKTPPPKYNGVVFEILGKHHLNFYNRI